jgi:hypothetical protein
VFLALSSFGLLLLWPRFVVLLPFMAMLFAYYFLAKVEEKECERKFGRSYSEYRTRTRMFLPIRVPAIEKLPGLPGSGLKKYLAILTLYLVTVAIAVTVAVGIRSWSLHSLYMLADHDQVYISVGKIEQARLEQVVAILRSSLEVQTRIEDNKRNENTKFINYVLPVEWYVSEIGMNRVEGGGGHHFPGDYDKSRYKVVLTRADLRPGQNSTARAILLNTIERRTVLEVQVDLSPGHVVEVLGPPETVPCEGIPRPVY